MPELPDITVYIEALECRIVGKALTEVRRNSPFLLRTVEPPLDAAYGRPVVGLRRLGKRIAIGFDNDVWFVLHLMIAGRLHWREVGAKVGGKTMLSAFDFETGSLVLTEAGTKKRASLHVVEGEDGLAGHDPGGMEVADGDAGSFGERLRQGNHTLKRALTDPRLFSGIGNAYSDEILLAARLSPVKLTGSLTDEEVDRLHQATVETLDHWTTVLRDETGDGFPEKVTAFRDGMAAHGRFGKPCPVCNTPIQRIRYASNETNYCPQCQTGGKVLADRSLSRLLKKDWPRTVDELEKLKPA